jgi:hypothetical protein
MPEAQSGARLRRVTEPRSAHTALRGIGYNVVLGRAELMPPH